MCPTCCCRSPSPSVQPSLCYIFSLHIPPSALYTHVFFFFFQKSPRYRWARRRKSVRCWSKTYPAYSPRGYYLCYLWAPAGFLPWRLSWNARRPGPLPWHSTPSSRSLRPGPARRLALRLFLKRLEFSQNMQLLCSVLFKPKGVFFLVFPAHGHLPMVLGSEGREPPFFSHKEART